VDVGAGVEGACVEQPDMTNTTITKVTAITCFVDIAFSWEVSIIDKDYNNDSWPNPLGSKANR